MTSRRGSGRALVALAGLVAVAGGLSACGGDGPGKVDAVVIDVPADRIASVTYTAGTKSATFEGKDGVFAPGPGGTAESATLINASDTTFPILAYRIMDDVDLATPDFGLVSTTASSPALRAKECGTGCSISLSATDGSTYKLSVGNRTFGSNGFYATVEGDPRVFLLVDDTVAQIISLATGRPFAFPPTVQEKKLAETQARLAEEAAGRGAPEANYDPYLRQVLAAEQDRKAAKEGRPGGALLQAATSTQDQPGSADAQASAAPSANPQPAQGQGSGGSGQ
ncbi:MAG TPA: hypothetical protein VMZ00_07415 [Sporichthya sp.]|nr:hypothetical protein [Sporichthya sp.]